MSDLSGPGAWGPRWSRIWSKRVTGCRSGTAMRLRREKLQGVTVLAAPAAAFENEAVVTMLSDDKAVRGVILDSGALAAARKSCVHVMAATISLSLVEELKAAHAKAGIAYVAGPGVRGAGRCRTGSVEHRRRRRPPGDRQGPAPVRCHGPEVLAARRRPDPGQHREDRRQHDDHPGDRGHGRSDGPDRTIRPESRRFPRHHDQHALREPELQAIWRVHRNPTPTSPGSSSRWD